MNDSAFLKVTQRVNPLGKVEQRTYQWVGDSPYVRVRRDFVSGLGIGPYRINIGPYRLLVIEFEPWQDTFLCVRADKLGALRVALYRATRLLDLAYRRMIVTLAVWNLAEFHPAYVPSWRDIKLVKRLLKK